jgi:hypothetical protein
VIEMVLKWYYKNGQSTFMHRRAFRGPPAADASCRVVEITQSYCRSDHHDFVAETRA